MMANIPKSLVKFMDKIGEIDTLPADEEAKYDVILKKGYTFTDDPMWNGRDGHRCSTWHSWETVREGVAEMREVCKCDCEACLKANGGTCQM